jgi:hypothetical protein
MITALLAATLLLHVTRGGETRALDVAIGHPGDEGQPAWAIHRHLAPNQSSMTVADLDRGAWIVLVRGPEPMQRTTAKIVVAENDKRRLDIALHPQRLHARVMAGTAPVANAVVNFSSLEDGWDGFAKTDANGWIDTAMWSGGDVEVVIHRTPDAMPVIRIARLHGGDAVTTINMPDHLIRGVLTDVTGTPIANGQVVIRTTTDQERTAGIRAKADAQGRFAFDAVDAGTHRLRPFAAGYLFAEPTNVTIAEDERVHEVRLTLSPGYQRDVIVRTNHGEPVADASIVCATSTRVRGKAFTDEHGHAIVPTPPDESSVLYVIPSDGSLAIHRLSAAINETSGKPIEIVMPPASASLQVNAKTADGKPMPDLSFLMRFDGEVIPPSVAKDGLLLRTSDHGEARLEHIPPGVYELWPYRDDDDVADLLETIGVAAAPININVTTGENRAAIRFQPRP